jgi:hypothetical protein
MIPERYNGMTITSDVERDFRADLTAGKCPDNAGCNACTACMCGLAEDAIAEVERLRALLAGERERALYEAMEIAEEYRPGHGDTEIARETERVACGIYMDIMRLLSRPATPSRDDVLIGALVKFAETAFLVSWDGCDLDGSEIQDMGVALGLLSKSEYDPSVHGDDFEGEPGDPYYTYSEAFKAIRESLQSNPCPAPDALRAMYEAMERDKALRKEAERRVREIRGSDDVPGFEACVEAEMEAMREIKVVDADARDLWCALNCANSRFIEPDAVGPDVHFVRTMLERHRAKYAPHDAIQSNPRPAPDVREE